ncbi:MAG: formyltetrahydrofolate deformylase [Hyphomonadaceae bacterium]
MSAARNSNHILRCMAPDDTGIISAVTGFLAERKLNIIESHDYGDPDTDMFFIRAEFSTANSDVEMQAIEAEFEHLARGFSMAYSFRASAHKPKALILVSKADHCLNDLLYRHRRGRLAVDVAAIVSNHMDAKWHADRHDLPFIHIPVTPDTKTEAEAKLRDVIAETGADFVILARYMQVLSNELCTELHGRCINIHHSFLPSFKGAKPYHQAHKRGVKLIGASAHYVTADLDEGPIIAQDVEPVDHRVTPAKMIAQGRDIEARTLARAVAAHAEGRIFLNGQRTVVFA